jgi:hypothetical protein
VSIPMLDEYPLGVVGIGGSNSGSNEPNQNRVQVLELIELESTRSRVEYGTRREIRGSVQPICKIST